MSERTGAKTEKSGRRWGPRMVLVLMAMIAVAFAFFGGLYIQAGLPMMPSLIAAFALFITLFGTLPKPRARTDLPEDLAARLALFENEIVSLSNQLEQFQGLSGKIGQLDDLAPTVQKLEGFLDEMITSSSELSDRQRADANASYGELSNKLKQLDNRINEMNSELENENTRQQTQLQMQIEDIDRLVRQLAEQQQEQKAPPPAAAPRNLVEAAMHPEPAPAPMPAPAPEPTPVEAAPVPAPPPPSVPPQNSAISERISASLNLPGMGDLDLEEQRALDIVTDAIENRRVEIYLQPVVELPKRKTAYYEVFTRLRGQGHNLILPNTFVPVAERAGLMPLIDNMMLIRAVKIIRQMDERARSKGLFCSLSTQSLVDPDFFPQLIAFLEKNRDLSNRIIFEISQAQKKSAGMIEREGMSKLGRLGFRFSLDKVIDLDIDFNDLVRRDFKFVRISAHRLIHGMAELGSRIHGADKASYLERYGLQLIVEKIETERELATLAEYNIKLGQGFLFAEPRPVRPEVLGERAA